MDPSAVECFVLMSSGIYGELVFPTYLPLRFMYDSEMPSALLSDTLTKLTNAESLYRQQNP